MARRRKRRVTPRFFVILALLIAAIVMAILAFSDSGTNSDSSNPSNTPAPGDTMEPGVSGDAEPTPTPAPTPTPVPEYSPAAVAGTRASDFGLSTAVQVNGHRVDSYTRAESIDFLEGEKYTDVEGVITFRGNNFRNSAFYGTAKILEKKFDTEPWSFSTGSMKKLAGEGSWTGSGWTGQPLIVKWPESTKQIMNLYDSAKSNPDLVEVIYATMDGHVYFLDLYTGKKTRDPINLGFPFKGAGALDPRGIPLMYVGSGDDSPNEGKGSSHVFILSLVTGEILYEFGSSDEFALRNLSYFDSSALVDAETDTLIYPGENGVVYTMKLNTQYDEAAGTLSIDPSEIVKWRYEGKRSNQDGKYWLGVEDSAIIWRGHAIFTDNGGHMICLDLNTYEVAWVQDTLDDTNCTPVLALEGEDNHPYVYTSTSFHGGWRAATDSKADVPIWKIDALTGEIVDGWPIVYQCGTSDGVSGGVQGTMAIGRDSLENLIFVPVARTPSNSRGLLVAIDRNTGKEVWRFEMERYPWSSPVAVYDENGNGYIIQCNQAGDMFLLDGLTGTLLDTINLGGNIEASPAVYNNTIVVGTRSNVIYGVTLK